MIVSTFGFAGSPGSPSFVRVELRLERGVLFRISGISNQAARASATRIRSALMACGHRWPGKAITVNLAPADLSRTSTAYDLPIALAVLASSGIIPSSALTHIAAAGEMGLDGTLRPWETSVFGSFEMFSSELSDVKNIKILLAPSKFDSSDSPLPLQPFTHLSEVIAYLKSPNKTKVKSHLIENPFNSIGNTSSFLEEVTFDIIKGEETTWLSEILLQQTLKV
jgi:magnesium chelatase family protein